MTQTIFGPSLIMSQLLTTLLIASGFWTVSFGLQTESCKTALGMKSGDIRDEDITASSSYNDAVGPWTARLEQEVNSGAWCPSKQIHKDTQEYLEINLRTLHVITQVATQGRFGNGQGQEFAEHYKLEYWRPGVHHWILYRNRTGHELLQGNTNTYVPVKKKVDPPIIASKIRFVPYSILLRTVCMRVEIYGCAWTEGLLSYSMPQGERRGLELDFSDNTYDGVRDDSYLNGGLGQLTDGVEGGDNFKADVYGYGKGFEWVGWKNDSSYSRPLEIVFAFDTVRNFSSMYFHCNNMFTKDIRVFASAKLWFSIGGKYYLGEPLHFSYMADSFIDKARNVTIFLHHRFGKFVKVELTFGSRWILVSEVSFSSVPAQGNFTEEEPPAAPPIVSTAVNDDSLSSQYVGLVIGVLAAVILLLIIVIFIIIARNRRRKHATPHTMFKPVENRVTINMKVALDDADPDKLLYQEPQDFKPFGGLYSNDSTTSREYAVPDVQKPSTPLGHPPPTPLNKPPFPQTLPKPPHPPCEKHYAATDVVKLPNIQGVSGSTVYAVPNVEMLNREENPVREITRHRLRFLEKLGEGQFGEVHLCEAEGIPELVDVPCYGNKTLVAVKTLRQDASDQARTDFYKEVKILSRLRDPNIVHVLGVCTREEPLAMIVEYMENGDLNQFLQQHVPDGAAYRSVNAKTLSYGSLIYMATQIASGMKYLESLNFVHRDLATRNCLVGRAYTLKVADFGMSRGLYTADYYRIEGRAVLPIRWMAWESILLGKFTTRSDVWAFAITLWEILTFARQQPYSDSTDEQVIENVGHFYHNDGLHVLPSQPPNCPKEIFDLMRECWQRNDNDRPNFREIHLFLQRKNLGYSPQL
ncbi:discoidin domain-containing receptor 2-like isoform X4 [Tachypleus tridentatus]|uniref:discoidin domain-containing receptor 2-like isoform X4 n=1 Tax=Tachypleus tridentatus TaxID=6853 RepID=UPI003FD19DF2